jgi:hypothetical protein
MATVHYMSTASVFTLADSAAQVRDISADITSIDGLPGEREMQDHTALGDTGRKHLPGLDNVTITLEGFFDDTASTGSDTVLSGLRTFATNASAFVFAPVGTGSTKRKFSGVCWVADYVVGTKVGELVPFKATLVVDGSVTIGAYS